MPDTVSRLERQLRAGWPWLRFAAPLEAEFRPQYEAQQNRIRLVLLITAVILIATTPLMDRFVLHPPEPFARFSHWLQLGVMVPAALIALAATAVPRLRHLARVTGLVAAAVIAAGVIWQRHAGAEVGYAVPAELASVVIAGVFVLGGLGFWTFLPLALLILGAMAVNEVATFGRNSATMYTIHAGAMLTLIAGVAGYLQEHLARGTWLRRALLEQLAMRDPLTGLLNSRAFEERYAQLCELGAREGRPLMVAVLDVDFFKDFNDYYGHAEGDRTLQRVAQQLTAQQRRASDLHARIGGEEFAMVCYDIDEVSALRMVEDLRLRVESQAIAHARSRVPGQVLTASIGATWFTPGPGIDGDSAMRMADTRLYASKHAGRNRITFGHAASSDNAWPQRAARPAG